MNLPRMIFQVFENRCRVLLSRNFHLGAETVDLFESSMFKIKRWLYHYMEILVTGQKGVEEMKNMPRLRDLASDSEEQTKTSSVDKKIKTSQSIFFYDGKFDDSRR